MNKIIVLSLLVCSLSGCSFDFFGLESNSAGETFRVNKVTGSVERLTAAGAVLVREAEKSPPKGKLSLSEYTVGKDPKYKVKVDIKSFGNSLSYKVTVSPHRESFREMGKVTTVTLVDVDGFLVENIVLQNYSFVSIQDDKGKKDSLEATGKVSMTPEQIDAIASWSPTWSGY